MNNAYQFVLECPSGHNINLQRKYNKDSLSETEAMKILRGEDVSCQKANCGWHGKASKARLLGISPFNWILAPISQSTASDPILSHSLRTH